MQPHYVPRNFLLDRVIANCPGAPRTAPMTHPCHNFVTVVLR